MSAPWVLDLFAGPGGVSQALASLGFSCRGLERDHDACDTARAAGHYRHQCDVAGEGYPHSIPGVWGRPSGVWGSPPCPGFSTGGLHTGHDDLPLLLAVLERVAAGDVSLAYAIAQVRREQLDERSALVLEPLRYALALAPEWLALEQVPAVLPVWQAVAQVLRANGWTADAGILSAEQYGVPMVRPRAVLVARDATTSAVHGPARLPAPTHSRYHRMDPARLDPGLPRWVSIADALGWSPEDRLGFPRRDDGRGVGAPVVLDGVAYRARDLHPATRPAPSLTEKARSMSRVTAAGHLERLTLEDASALATFPRDYPWKGSRTAQFHQLGNAVPPRMARAVVLAAATTWTAQLELAPA